MNSWSQKVCIKINISFVDTKNFFSKGILFKTLNQLEKPLILPGLGIKKKKYKHHCSNT